MPSRRKKAKSVPFNPSEVASIAKSNPYIQRLIEDASLRDNVRAALDSTKHLYERLTDGKTSAKTLFEDKKVQAELRKTVEAVRDVTTALTEAPKARARKGIGFGRKTVEAVRDVTTALTESPKERARKGIGFGRKVMIAGLGGALALVGSEKLRSKVLDVLFGAEEEFEYTAPQTTPAPEATETADKTPTGAA